MDEDPLAGWLAEDDTGPDSAGQIGPAERVPQGRSRLRRMLLFAAAPWVIVALLALGARVLASDEPAASPTGPTEPDSAGSVGSSAGLSATVAPGEPLPQPSAPAGPSPEPERAPSPDRSEGAGVPTAPVGARDSFPASAEAAAATLAVRAARTTTARTAEGPLTYVDHAVAESAVTLADGTRLVAVLAVVLDGDGRRWRATRTVRYAVPLRPSADGPVLAGAVYALPFVEPVGRAESGRWVALADPGKRRSAAAVLRAAGYRIDSGLRLHRRPDTPLLRARFRGVGPNEVHASAQGVWLRDGARPRLASPGL